MGNSNICFILLTFYIFQLQSKRKRISDAQKESKRILKTHKEKRRLKIELKKLQKAKLKTPPKRQKLRKRLNRQRQKEALQSFRLRDQRETAAPLTDQQETLATANEYNLMTHFTLSRSQKDRMGFNTCRKCRGCHQTENCKIIPQLPSELLQPTSAQTSEQSQPAVPAQTSEPAQTPPQPATVESKSNAFRQPATEPVIIPQQPVAFNL